MKAKAADRCLCGGATSLFSHSRTAQRPALGPDPQDLGRLVRPWSRSRGFPTSAEGVGVANSLFTSDPISRLQRDLSDSTVERTFGTAFAHSLIGYHALVRGFGKVGVNEQALRDALVAHPEVLAEAIQTVLRVATSRCHMRS